MLTDTFNLTIIAGNGTTDIEIVSIIVTGINDAPMARNDSFTVSENSTDNSLDVLNGSGADLDVEGDIFTITAVDPSSQGGSVFINAAKNALIYSPLTGFSGTDRFSYFIAAPSGAVGSTDVVVEVVANTPPDAGDDNFPIDGPVTILEDSVGNELPVLEANGDSSFAFADFDNDLDPITVVRVQNPGSSGGTITVKSGNKVLLYTPAPDFGGTETFTYTISDGRGGEDTATVTVAVTPIPDLPTLSEIGNQVIDEDNSTDVLGFTVGDPETGASSLIITVTSDNPP
jgi:hypothetical protein